jgi:Zn-dependent protease with chaperone function
VTAPVLLLLFAVLAASAGWLLQNARWTVGAPRLGILTWQALTGSVVLSVVLAGAALALPAMPAAYSLAGFLQACADTLRERYSTPGGAVLSTIGAAGALLVVLRLSYCLIAELLTARKGRQEQLGSLALVSRRDAKAGILIVDHAAPAAYCLPGRRSEIVFTTAALEALDEAERNAVYSHELAHLRGRHDLVLIVSSALARAFPGIPVFSQARVELGRLVELAADDSAAAGNSRISLATALVRLAEAGATPSAALGAGGSDALLRVRRLAAPATPVRTGRALLTVVAAVGMLVLPLGVAAAPAAASAQATMCPVSLDQFA